MKRGAEPNMEALTCIQDISVDAAPVYLIGRKDVKNGKRGRVSQSEENQTLNLVVAGSRPAAFTNNMGNPKIPVLYTLVAQRMSVSLRTKRYAGSIPVKSART